MLGLWVAGAASATAPARLTAPPAGLAALARAILGPDQGVYVETATGEVLLAQAAARAVHPASVSKIPTTLALLRKLGPEHRFVTTFASNGQVIDGVLQGDLLVGCGGDPAFVDEDALLVTDRLIEIGIRRVAGNLLARGSCTFDWQSDADGARLRQALSGSIPPAALAAVRAFELENSAGVAPAPTALNSRGIAFAATSGAVIPAGSAASVKERVLVTHRSQPLLPLAKSLNDYSNNIFKPLADEAGGAAAVESTARGAVPPAMREEITLGDGAGTDPSNRLSPRVVVNLLRALDKELQSTGHALFDILPVSGVDDGTLRHRLDGPGEAGHVVGKTGTYGDYGASALVGALSTTDHGTVYFAILNHGVPVPEARRRQDRFVRALLAHLPSRSWEYQRDPRPAIARAEVVKAP